MPESEVPPRAHSDAIGASLPGAPWVPEREASPPAIGQVEAPAGAATSASRPAKSASAALHRNGHVLGLQVLEDALVAALAAEAGLLDAAERRRRVGDHALVEPDHAGLEPFADAQGALDVAGVDVGDEPVLGVVGGRDGLVLVREGCD